MRLPRKFSQGARKTFFFIHLWTGLILGLWFVAIGLSGTVLAWRSEITSWEVRHRVGAPLPKAGDKIIPASQAGRVSEMMLTSLRANAQSLRFKARQWQNASDFNAKMPQHHF